MMTDEPQNEKPNKTRSWIERILAVLAGEPQNREELMEILRDAQDRHVVSAEILSMIERVLQVSEMQVREVMVPKAQMIFVEKNQGLEKILPVVIESGHSRFPVFDPANKDIIGILLAKDILKFCFAKDTSQFKLADMLRPAIFTPQSKRLNVLLREFRINRNHLAIVLDEYGHITGLITIEDVLEQIVGEIEDEYDVDEEADHIKKLDDGSYIVKATTSIKDFNDYFAVKLKHEQTETLGSFLLKTFGHLPHRGETVRLQNFRFRVLHSDNRRIYLLEVKPLKKRKEEI